MMISFVIPSSAKGPVVLSSGQPLRITRNDLLRLEKCSVHLRDLLQNRYLPRPIPLAPDYDEDIDADAIKYLLKNLGHPEPRSGGSGRGTRKIGIDQLSRRCNALWYYRCDPTTFGGLWERLDRPWELGTGVDWHEYCWRRPPPKFSERETLQYANAAWVLEKNDVFTQAIQSAVWDSREDTLRTAITALKGITTKRSLYLQQVFEVMASHVAALMTSKATWDIGNKIQRRIRDSEKLGFQLVATLEDLRGEAKLVGWDQCKEKLLRFSVYGFVYQVDLVLLKDTSDSSVLPPSSTSLQDSDATPIYGPKNTTTINVRRLVKRIFGDPYKDEVRKMLGRIDAQLRAEQTALASSLIDERDRILQEWKGSLQQIQVVQSPELPAELG